MNEPIRSYQHMVRSAWIGLSLAVLTGTGVQAQVSAYTFSQGVSTWQPIAGNGTPLGMPGMPPPFTFDDNSFVTQGESIPLGSASTGNGWPIGFMFHYNGHAYDRVGLSMEGWLAFGRSADGPEAVYVPVGSGAYTPLSSPAPGGLPALMRDRVAGFSNDLAAMGNGGTWPIQIRTMGVAPDRVFVAEWNVVRSGTSNVFRFQIRLSEGGGDPAAQTVQVVYGSMAQSGSATGQVGLGGSDPSDFNNRSITASPYDWTLSEPGTTNTATGRVPTSEAQLPQGLTFTWTPPACGVNGIAISDLLAGSGTISATLSWLPTTGASSYSYVITAGGPTDTPVLSGTGITGTEVALTDLPPGQHLFAYVQADCAPEGLWGSGLPFTTESAVEVVCGQPPVEVVHCYSNYAHDTWTYSSSSGAPLRVIFHEGLMGLGDLLTCYDGPNAQSPLLFTSASGAVAGQVVNSTGGHLTIRILADDLSACDDTEWLEPLAWEVGCVDCDPVMADYAVTDDCTNGQFSVNVTIFSMGSATSVPITNDWGAPVVTANGPGSYAVGPFPVGTPVIVRAENPDNDFCSSVSTALLNGACPVVSCGPDTYTYCYTDEDAGQWAYQADGNERIGIRFLSGTLASGDVIRIYDGLDPFMSAPLFVGDNGGDLSGLVVTTSAGNADHAFLMEVAANTGASCATGQATPWESVVACYDGCTAPEATFTVVPDCDNGRFTVSVDLTSLGSAATVQLVNDGGAPAVTATTSGSYSVGPFSSGTAVQVSVEGDGVLCSIASQPLTIDCNVGVREHDATPFSIYPNPNDGSFHIAGPVGFGGRLRMDVLDITGRTVARHVLQDLSGRDAVQDLGYLPAGSYTLLLSNDEGRWTSRVSIQR